MQKIPGCEESSNGDVDEWMTQDDKDHFLGGEEIAAMIKAKEKDEESECEGMEDEGKTKSMTHTEGLKEIEGTLRYFEEQSTTSPMGILFLRRLRDEAARRRNESTNKQSTITRFFSKK